MINRFPHAGDAHGATPGHPLLVPALSAARDLSMSPQQAMLDWEAIKRIPGLAGYWPAGIEYLWADDAGTTLPSVGGGIGKRLDAFGVNHATQATATFKPILRQTSASNLYWLDSNTPGSALTATLGNLGTACTVAQIDATGPYFTENVTITSTYNLTAPYGYGGDIAIFNRALTASEKALVTRYMRRSYPEYDFPVRGAPDAWWLTVDTTDVSQTWTVAIETGTTPNITVDWGDATVDTYTTLGDKTHTYATAGRWYPKISGSFASGGNICFGKDATNRSRLKATAIVPTIPGLANFTDTFSDCTGVAAIPVDLFRYNTNVTADAFYKVFYQCTGLTSIPADIFKYNTLVGAYGFYSAFEGCTGISQIPTDLFRYNTLGGELVFQATFKNCVSLTSIPVDLFKYNTAVGHLGFRFTFWNCSGLTTLPVDLFRHNTACTSFRGTFLNCTGLTTLPVDLFRYNTAVSTQGFQSTFQGCTGLTTLPVDLFRHNTACTSFSGVFQNCDKLQLRSDIFFPAGGETTRFLNQSVDFTNAMCIGTFTGTQGTAPALWDCSYGTGTPTTTTCFTGQTAGSVTNYASIPTAWGGA